MGQRHCFCLILSLLVLGASCVLAATESEDGVALKALADNWQKKPTNWIGIDPCGDGWVGIKCKDNRVVSVRLSSLGLEGTLSGDIGALTELHTLDLSYNTGLNGPLPQPIVKLTKLSNLILVGCRFSGQIPDISSLKELVYLSLNFNQFNGEIPRSIGNLTKLYWLDMADNMLTGTIPISDGKTLGLDNLKKTKHFHFGNNQLSGSIPAQLFSSSMTLIHVLFENNNLDGGIPSSLGLVKDLEAVRLDRNSLTGPVPSNINNLTSVQELYLSNNQLTGSLPNLTGMRALRYLDLSNNSFDSSDAPPWFTTLKSLTTVVLERLQIRGEIPGAFFSPPQLQTVRLMNNKFNGTLNITTYSSQLQLVDLRNNQIKYMVEGERYDKNLMLMGNPLCEPNGPEKKYCRIQQANPSYKTTIKCTNTCLTNRKISPKCHCAYPYHGVLYFRALSFSDLANPTPFRRLEKKLMSTFESNQISIDSVNLYNLSWDAVNYLRMNLQIFPYSKEIFNETDVLFLGFILSNQTFKPPEEFGTFYFEGTPYRYFQGSTKETSKSNNLPLIIGVSVAGVVFTLIIIFLAIFVIKKKRKADKVVERRQPFSHWDSTQSSGSIPLLKGARQFTPNELEHITDNFSDYNVIGSGSYGKVYKGIVSTGLTVAIKRVQQGSMQGGHQFKTEIETLTRVHHKNLVNLIGFCFDQGVLVYEYVCNGSLWDSLSGKSGIQLDWRKRLWIAIDTARGLSYLHELADPPIIHRDVKSANILLDQQLNAKVSDFGLSKLLGDGEKDHITTQVKGTMGYMDPEYYMTQQLTEKSDVYGFGVVMLELITGRKPIERGKYIVREMKMKINRSQSLYGLNGLIDSALGSPSSLEGLEKYIDVAMQCVEELGADRPTMSEVVKEIEGILQLVRMNPNVDSGSSSYEKPISDNQPLYPYNDEVIAGYNSSFPTPR